MHTNGTANVARRVQRAACTVHDFFGDQTVCADGAGIVERANEREEDAVAEDDAEDERSRRPTSSTTTDEPSARIRARNADDRRRPNQRRYPHSGAQDSCELEQGMRRDTRCDAGEAEQARGARSMMKNGGD